MCWHENKHSLNSHTELWVCVEAPVKQWFSQLIISKYRRTWKMWSRWIYRLYCSCGVFSALFYLSSSCLSFHYCMLQATISPPDSVILCLVSLKYISFTYTTCITYCFVIFYIMPCCYYSLLVEQQEFIEVIFSQGPEQRHSCTLLNVTCCFITKIWCRRLP